MKSEKGTKVSRAKRLAARLHFSCLLNARDLGGCTIRGGPLTRARSILRTDDLWRLTPPGMRALLDHGVRSVIDLRWPHELAARPSLLQRGINVRCTNVSLLDGTESACNSKCPGVPKEKWNCAVLDHAPRELAQALHAVTDAPRGVVLFHCAAGKDRTGAVAALLLAAAVVEPEEITVPQMRTGRSLVSIRYPESSQNMANRAVIRAIGDDSCRLSPGDPNGSK
jgi:protein-tyrosine phosphatase